MFHNFKQHLSTASRTKLPTGWNIGSVTLKPGFNTEISFDVATSRIHPSCPTTHARIHTLGTAFHNPNAPVKYQFKRKLSSRQRLFHLFNFQRPPVPRAWNSSGKIHRAAWLHNPVLAVHDFNNERQRNESTIGGSRLERITRDTSKERGHETWFISCESNSSRLSQRRV